MPYSRMLEFPTPTLLSNQVLPAVMKILQIAFNALLKSDFDPMDPIQSNPTVYKVTKVLNYLTGPKVR